MFAAVIIQAAVTPGTSLADMFVGGGEIVSTLYEGSNPPYFEIHQNELDWPNYGPTSVTGLSSSAFANGLLTQTDFTFSSVATVSPIDPVSSNPFFNLSTAAFTELQLYIYSTVDTPFVFSFNMVGAGTEHASLIGDDGSSLLYENANGNTSGVFTGRLLANVSYAFDATSEVANTVNWAYTVLNGYESVSMNFSTIPEPSSLGLVSLGVMGSFLAACRRRRTR
jgi:hypothetical protein